VSPARAQSSLDPAQPTHVALALAEMADSQTNVDHLKQLISQLQAKVERLEQQAQSTATDAKNKVADSLSSAKDAVKDTLAGTNAQAKEALTPAQHLRLVLMGPPGAGEPPLLLVRALDPPSPGWEGLPEGGDGRRRGGAVARGERLPRASAVRDRGPEHSEGALAEAQPVPRPCRRPSSPLLAGRS